MSVKIKKSSNFDKLLSAKGLIKHSSKEIAEHIFKKFYESNPNLTCEQYMSAKRQIRVNVKKGNLKFKIKV